MDEDTMNGTDAHSPTGQVTDKVQLINEIVNKLFKDSEVLSIRLAPIMLPESPVVEERDSEDTPQYVPLAEQLNNIYHTLNRLHIRLSDMGDRISL